MSRRDAGPAIKRCVRLKRPVVSAILFERQRPQPRDRFRGADVTNFQTGQRVRGKQIWLVDLAGSLREIIQGALEFESYYLDWWLSCFGRGAVDLGTFSRHGQHSRDERGQQRGASLIFCLVPVGVRRPTAIRALFLMSQLRASLITRSSTSISLEHR